MNADSSAKAKIKVDQFVSLLAVLVYCAQSASGSIVEAAFSNPTCLW